MSEPNSAFTLAVNFTDARVEEQLLLCLLLDVTKQIELTRNTMLLLSLEPQPQAEDWASELAKLWLTSHVRCVSEQTFLPASFTWIPFTATFISPMSFVHSCSFVTQRTLCWLIVAAIKGNFLCPLEYCPHCHYQLCHLSAHHIHFHLTFQLMMLFVDLEFSLTVVTLVDFLLLVLL